MSEVVQWALLGYLVLMVWLIGYRIDVMTKRQGVNRRTNDLLMELRRRMQVVERSPTHGGDRGKIKLQGRLGDSDHHP